MTNVFAIRRLKQFGGAEEGQALALGAFVLVVLMLMAGLGVDVGYLRYEKLQMQKAADAGAIAGAAALIYGGQVQLAARNDSAANGFTNGNNGVTVAVNNPPASGPFAGNNNYVEVIVAQATPTFFLRVGGFSTVNVSSRAVASSLGSSSGCIYALDPTDSAAFTASGSVNISSNCGIRVNSNSPSALYKTGSGNISVERSRSDGIGVVGGVSEAGSGTISPTPTQGIPTFGDPLAYVPAQTPGSCTPQIGTINKSTTLYAGTFCKGIQISGNNNVVVTFGQGTYILLGGGLSVTGSPILTGSNVTFYNTGSPAYPYAPVTITGSSSSTLSAPTSGPLAGMLVFQDRSVVSTALNSIDGSHGEIYTGAFYFPTTPVTYTANSTFPPYVIIDAWQVTMLGTSAIGNTYTSLPDGASPIHSAVLVE